MARKVQIKVEETGDVLAEGVVGDDVTFFEGNYYFEPGSVKVEAFKKNGKLYTCSYKGVCDYYDATVGEATVADAAWLYPDPDSYEEEVKGKYGFLAYSNNGISVEESNE